MRPEMDPDPEWVAALSGGTLASSRHAVSEAGGERSLFRHLVREHEREGRVSYIEIDAPLEIYALTRLLRPRHLLEVGVSSGVSSAYLLSALRANGRGVLHSIDLPSRPRPGGGGRTAKGSSWSLPTGRDSGWAIPRDLQTGWDLRLGDKSELVPALVGELSRVGLVLYDVPHDCDELWQEFQRLDGILPRGAVIIVDHGPHGELCPALRRWGRSRLSHPVRRTGLGLFGVRAAAGPRLPSAPPHRAPRAVRPRARAPSR